MWRPQRASEGEPYRSDDHTILRLRSTLQGGHHTRCSAQPASQAPIKDPHGQKK
jgi:hypothetical protein